jgi:hypothetical protein
LAPLISRLRRPPNLRFLARVLPLKCVQLELAGARATEKHKLTRRCGSLRGGPQEGGFRKTGYHDGDHSNVGCDSLGLCVVRQQVQIGARYMRKHNDRHDRIERTHDRIKTNQTFCYHNPRNNNLVIKNRNKNNRTVLTSPFL